MKATRVCSVEGCDAPVGAHGAKGMCAVHYSRMRRWGTTELVPHPPPDIEERLWGHLKVTDTGCAEWTRSTTTKGYGCIQFKERLALTHRVAWELTNGPIPEGLCVCHRCDNPPCCNPEHLFLGTYADNIHDMIAKGRGRNQNAGKAYCKYGHAFDEENTVTSANGRRHCRICMKVLGARANAKRTKQRRLTRGD